MNIMKCCDNCRYYNWYYDYCDKYDCEVDAREMHGCYEERQQFEKAESGGGSDA